MSNLQTNTQAASDHFSRNNAPRLATAVQLGAEFLGWRQRITDLRKLERHFGKQKKLLDAMRDSSERDRALVVLTDARGHIERLLASCFCEAT